MSTSYIFLIAFFVFALCILFGYAVSTRARIDDLKHEILKKIDERYLDIRYKIADDACDTRHAIGLLSKKVDILTKPIEDVVADTAKKLFNEANIKEG